MTRPPPSRARERFGGALLLAIGVALVLFNWSLALGGDAVYTAASVVGPVVAVLGAALVLVPGPRRERADLGLDGGGLTPRWRAIAGLALAAGVANLLVLTSELPARLVGA